MNFFLAYLARIQQLLFITQGDFYSKRRVYLICLFVIRFGWQINPYVTRLKKAFYPTISRPVFIVTVVVVVVVVVVSLCCILPRRRVIVTDTVIK